MLKVANSVISASRITGVLPVANGGTNASTASITSFNNITGFTASGTTGTTSTNLVFATTPTLVGDVTLSTGNLVIGTSGKGIDFSVTSSGSGTMTSELLADYEEGTWTGLIAGTTTVGTFTNLANSCSYTKIGRQVTVQYYVQWESGTGTGNLLLTGLPFTSRNAAGFYYAGTLSYANVVRTASSTPAPNVYHNSTQIEYLQIPTTDGDSTSIAYDAAGRLMGMHTYFTD